MTYLKMQQFPFVKYLLILIFLSLPGFTQAQWNYLNSPISNESFMEVITEDIVVYSLGNSGEILRTVDGGENWSSFQTGLEYTWIFDFDFPTDEIGYGCGGTYFGMYNDVIIKTENAGLTWDTLTTNSFGVYTFNRIDFLNTDTGFVAGGTLLLRTQDGGVNFSPIEIEDEGLFSISDIYSTSEGILFVSGQKAVSSNGYHMSIYRSSDLGETWQEVYADDMQPVDNLDNRFVTTMHFPTPETGYAAGGNGLFLKTTDAGITWSQSFISPFTNLTTLYFTSVNVGYTNNAGGIYKTTDGGISWEAQNMDVPAIVNEIQFASENVGYAFSTERIYNTINGGVVLSISEVEIADQISVFPNPTNGFFSVTLNDGLIENIKVYDVAGKLSLLVDKNFERIDVSALVAGTYILEVKTEKGIVTKKMVVD